MNNFLIKLIVTNIFILHLLFNFWCKVNQNVKFSNFKGFTYPNQANKEVFQIFSPSRLCSNIGTK